jgi:hypothetical protein
MKNKFFPVEMNLSSGSIPSTRNQNILVSVVKKCQFFHARMSHQIQTEIGSFMIVYESVQNAITSLRISSSGNGGSIR